MPKIRAIIPSLIPSDKRLHTANIPALVARATAAAERRIVGALATLAHIRRVAQYKLLNAWLYGYLTAVRLIVPIISVSDWYADGGSGYDMLKDYQWQRKPGAVWHWQAAANAHQSFNDTIGWKSIVEKSKAIAAAEVSVVSA